MYKTYKWSVLPKTTPTVLRYCPKCGRQSEFLSSKSFRVNANQNNIDVWLIYQCDKCSSTWNVEILSRVDSSTISKDIYQKFISNNQELADYYAYDVAIHNKNKAVMNFDSLQYDISGDNISLTDIREAIQIQLSCSYPTNMRLDKLLSQKLCISREKVRKFIDQNIIYSNGIKDLGRAKLRGDIKINILP